MTAFVSPLDNSNRPRLRRPRLLRRSWVSVLTLAMMISSDYKLRLRPPDSSLSAKADPQTLAEVGVYGAVGVFLLLQLGSPRLLRRSSSPLLVAAWAWALVMALSCLWAIYPLFAAVRGVQLLLIAGLAQAIASHARREHLHLFAHAFIAVATASVGLGFTLRYPNYGRSGFNWFFTHPVLVGSYLGIAVTLLVSYLLRPRRSDRDYSPTWPTWVYVGTLVICLGGLIGTKTRGAMGAAVIGAIVILLFGSDRRRRLDITVVGVVAIIIIAILFGPTIIDFLARGQDTEKLESFSGRTPLWAEAFALVSQRPLLGYGLTSSDGLFLETIGLGGGHNAFISVLTDAGLIGATLWLTLIVSVFIVIHRLWHFPNVRADLALLCAVMTFLVVNGITVEGLATAANVANIWCYVIVGWLAVLATEARDKRAIGATGSGAPKGRRADTSPGRGRTLAGEPTHSPPVPASLDQPPGEAPRGSRR